MDISLITNPDTEYSKYPSPMPNIHRPSPVPIISAHQYLNDCGPYSQISNNYIHTSNNNNIAFCNNIINPDRLHEYYAVFNDHQYNYSNSSLYSTSPSCNSLQSASDCNDDKPAIERISDVSSVRSDSSIHIKQVSIDDISMKVCLNAEDVTKLVRSAQCGRNPLKSKRDLAMLYLLLDLKFACQKIADLKYRDVYGILAGTCQGIYRYSGRSDVPVKTINCHQKTAQSIRDWVDEVNNVFGWPYEADAPLFVPLSLFGDNREPKRVCLKRDAISKVFTAIKVHAGVNMTKEIINRTIFVDL